MVKSKEDFEQNGGKDDSTPHFIFCENVASYLTRNQVIEILKCCHRQKAGKYCRDSNNAI